MATSAVDETGCSISRSAVRPRGSFRWGDPKCEFDLPAGINAEAGTPFVTYDFSEGTLSGAEFISRREEFELRARPPASCRKALRPLREGRDSRRGFRLPMRTTWRAFSLPRLAPPRPGAFCRREPRGGTSDASVSKHLPTRPIELTPTSIRRVDLRARPSMRPPTRSQKVQSTGAPTLLPTRAIVPTRATPRVQQRRRFQRRRRRERRH